MFNNNGLDDMIMPAKGSQTNIELEIGENREFDYILDIGKILKVFSNNKKCKFVF